MATIKFLLANWLKKRAKNKFTAAGFTLLELIIALTVAALVITPLISVAVTLLETDRKEQAKTASEDEIQTAIEYISRDLQQAVYIYNAEQLNATGEDGIADEIYVEEGLTPVLFFWKRKFIEDGRPINRDADCQLNDPDEDECDDTFVYSLVGYYLIEGRNDQDKWSNALRIGRFEIEDGVDDPFDADPDVYIDDRDPDDGFAPFDLRSGNVKKAMREWTNSGETFGGDSLPQSNVLIDYIDQTETIDDAEGCPPDSDPNDEDEDPEWTKIPNDDNFPGFYVCVFTSQNKARVFLRGNALARVRKRQNPPPTYDEGTQAFFPRARIEVRGTGLLRSR